MWWSDGLLILKSSVYIQWSHSFLVKHGSVFRGDVPVCCLQLRRMQEMIARMQAQMQLQMQGGDGDSAALGHHV